MIIVDCRCATCGFTGAAGATSAKQECYKDSVTEVTKSTPGLVMGFGSGNLEALIATDTVTIGTVQATMTDQLLLMVAKDADLQKVDFDGILGLGIPEKADPTHNKDWRSGNITREVKNKATGVEYTTKSFLEAAGLTRFSICFQDGTSAETSPGYLRIGIDELGNSALGSVGTVHWGLDFRGVSVGTSKAIEDALFCKPEDKKGPMTSPCGAIPDSGTTLMLGPAANITTLYEEICDDWQRCAKEFKAEGDSLVETVKKQMKDRIALENVLKKALGGTEEKISESDLNAVAVAKVKSTLVETLLPNCSSWLTDTNTLDDELPDLNFYLKGAHGKDQTLTFKGSQYIESGELEDIDQIQKAAGSRDGSSTNDGVIGDSTSSGSSVNGITGTGGANFLDGRRTLAKEPYVDFFKRARPRHDKKTKKTLVCMAAFDTVDYNTVTNGPVWILGTPLFYSFQVSFEADPDKGGPSMKFDEGGEKCEACAASMLDGASKRSASKGMPRRIKSKPRWPSKPMSGPL